MTPALSRRSFGKPCQAEWPPPDLVELMAVCGFYHLVSFLANGAGVEREEAGRRFPE